MSSSYFDIIILGTDLAPLMSAALLAKRGFRILVLGQQYDRADYQVGRFRLPRRPFVLGGGRGLLARRLFAELGLTQSLRRSGRVPDTAFQLALPGHRFDMPSDPAELQTEIEREFPGLLPAVEALRQRVDEHTAASDALFEQDNCWPPESLLERRRITRIEQQLAALRAGDDGVLSGFSAGHAFRPCVTLPAAFAAHCEPSTLGDLELTRLFAAQARDALIVEGGLAGLSDLLVDKIRAHSGQLRLQERATQIIVDDGAVRGVRLFGSDEVIGTAVVVIGVDVGALQRLLVDRSPLDQLIERVGEPRPTHYRYTLNAVVRREGIPVGMKRDVYFLRQLGNGLGADNVLHVELSTLDSDHRLLCAEALLPARTPSERDAALEGTRERLLSILGELVPFIDQHLVMLDSPHDGRKPWAASEDLDVALARFERRGLPTLPVIHRFTKRDSICALPVKTPLRGLLLCNQQVAPGLGVEGQFLAAASVAHVARRADRAREWMRKKLWTKVDI